jgi:hypothetical protein
VHPSEIECDGSEIGGGTFGKVLKGKCRGKDVAIKVLHRPITNEKMLAAFKGEVEIMRFAAVFVSFFRIAFPAVPCREILCPIPEMLFFHGMLLPSVLLVENG